MTVGDNCSSTICPLTRRSQIMYYDCLAYATTLGTYSSLLLSFGDLLLSHQSRSKARPPAGIGSGTMSSGGQSRKGLENLDIVQHSRPPLSNESCHGTNRCSMFICSFQMIPYTAWISSLDRPDRTGSSKPVELRAIIDCIIARLPPTASLPILCLPASQGSLYRTFSSYGDRHQCFLVDLACRILSRGSTQRIPVRRMLNCGSATSRISVQTL
jgi:hypothetical protein